MGYRARWLAAKGKVVKSIAVLNFYAPIYYAPRLHQLALASLVMRGVEQPPHEPLGAAWGGPRPSVDRQKTAERVLAKPRTDLNIVWQQLVALSLSGRCHFAFVYLTNP